MFSHIEIQGKLGSSSQKKILFQLYLVHFVLLVTILMWGSWQDSKLSQVDEGSDVSGLLICLKIK